MVDTENGSFTIDSGTPSPSGPTTGEITVSYNSVTDTSVENTYADIVLNIGSFPYYYQVRRYLYNNQTNELVRSAQTSVLTLSSDDSNPYNVGIRGHYINLTPDT